MAWLRDKDSNLG